MWSASLIFLFCLRLQAICLWRVDDPFDATELYGIPEAKSWKRERRKDVFVVITIDIVVVDDFIRDDDCVCAFEFAEQQVKQFNKLFLWLSYNVHKCVHCHHLRLPMPSSRDDSAWERTNEITLFGYCAPLCEQSWGESRRVCVCVLDVVWPLVFIPYTSLYLIVSSALFTPNMCVADTV